MNKLYSIWAGLVAVAMLASCAKTVETSQEDLPVTIEEGMTFSASLNPGTRSHFADDSSPALEWDENEPVMIASARVSGFTADMFGEDDAAATAALNTLVVKGIGHAEVNADDKTQALIRTTKTQEQWLYSPNPNPSDTYLFFAYYPVSEVRDVFMQTSGEVFVDFEIPAVQDGRSYWKYQLFYDYKMANEDFVKYYTREGIESGTTAVTFEDFQPVNTLLRFRLKLPDGMDGSYQVSKIVLTASGTDRAIVGKCTCNIVENWLNPAAEGASMSLTLDLDDPVTVTSTAPEDYLYASIISQKDNGFAGTFNLTFAAYDESDNLILQASKTSPEGGLEAGKRYNFDVPMIPAGASAFSVSALGDIPFDGMDWNATVTSFKTDPLTGNAVPLAYAIQAFADEDCTQEATFSVKENSSEGTTTYSIPGLLNFTLPTGHDFAAGTDLQETIPVHFYGNPGVGQMTMFDTATQIRSTLRTASPVGTVDAPFNLSNSTGAAAIQNTANCYIVNAPGYYRLPLVIGNAIENGDVNTGAFALQGEIPEGDIVCVHFHDYLDGDIDGPYIHNSSEVVRTSGHVPTSACILWEDSQNLVEADATTFLLDAPAADVNGVYWLQFHIPAETIDQGNALIAVKDEEGTIMWSWHIWVTDITADRDVPFDGAVGDGSINDESTTVYPVHHMMMTRNLGWVATGSGSETVYDPFEAYLLLTQEETGETVKIKVAISGKTIVSEMEDGYNPFFQSGRKDPLIPASGSPKSGLYTDKQVWGLSNTDGISVLHVENSEEATYGNAIRHPESFIYVSSANGIYTKVLEKRNLWNVAAAKSSSDTGSGTIYDDSFIKKSVYDPSPAGYCVPGSSVFLSLMGTTYSALGRADLDKDSDLSLDRIVELFGDRVCSANEWGVSYYTDKEKSGTIYLPSTNVRLQRGNIYDQTVFFDEASGIIIALVTYLLSDRSDVLATNFVQGYPYWGMPLIQDLTVSSPIRCVREGFTVGSALNVSRPGRGVKPLDYSLTSALPQWALTPAMEMVASGLRK